MLDRKAALKRCEEATPGPWKRPFDDGAITADGDTSLLGLDSSDMAIVWSKADAEFIAHARTDLPNALAMLDRIDQARADLARREKVCLDGAMKSLSADEDQRLRGLANVYSTAILLLDAALKPS